jgi:hypothetical protein
MLKELFKLGTKHERTQFPLRPAAAKTIHKSQGDTMDDDSKINEFNFTRGSIGDTIFYVNISSNVIFHTNGKLHMFC